MDSNDMYKHRVPDLNSTKRHFYNNFPFSYSIEMDIIISCTFVDHIIRDERRVKNDGFPLISWHIKHKCCTSAVRSGFWTQTRNAGQMQALSVKCSVNKSQAAYTAAMCCCERCFCLFVFHIAAWAHQTKPSTDSRTSYSQTVRAFILSTSVAEYGWIVPHVCLLCLTIFCLLHHCANWVLLAILIRILRICGFYFGSNWHLNFLWIWNIHIWSG